MSESHEVNDRLYNIEDLECLLDNIPFEVCLKDKDGKHIYINKKGAEKIGLSKKEIIGRKDKDLKSEEIYDTCEENNTRVLEMQDRLFCEKKLYNNKFNRVYKFPVKDKNDNVKFIGEYIHDITYKKNIDKQFKKLFIENSLDMKKIEYKNSIKEILNNLNYMMDSTSVNLFLFDKETNNLIDSLNSYKTENKNLQDKNKKLEEAIGAEMIKINFLENMSHEFRTPINIILMTSQLLITLLDRDINEIDKEKIVNHLKTLRQNGYRILRLVNNILDTTKFDNDLERLKLGNYNIVGLIEDIILSTSEYIQNRQIIFNTEEEELILACNPDAIEKIILNLLSNSLKFTNEDGKIEVDIKVDHKEEKLFVYLRNNGPSISKEYSQKIFDRFVQTDNNLRRVSEGSGIGLYLVKLLVEMHEGKIWLNTKIEDGVEFVFYIPIKSIDSIDDIMLYNIEEHTIIDKCRIEFSDVYSI